MFALTKQCCGAPAQVRSARRRNRNATSIVSGPFRKQATSPTGQTVKRGQTLGPMRTRHHSRGQGRRRGGQTIHRRLLSHLPLTQHSPSGLLTRVAELQRVRLTNHLSNSNEVGQGRLRRRFTTLGGTHRGTTLPALLLPSFSPAAPPATMPTGGGVHRPSEARTPEQVICKSHSYLSLPVPSNPPLPRKKVTTLSPCLPKPLSTSLRTGTAAISLRRPRRVAPIPIVATRPAQRVAASLSVHISTFLERLSIWFLN